MKSLPEHMIWYDLECTGSDETAGDEIVEFGLVWTRKNLVELDSLTVVVQPSNAALARLLSNDYVREMHTRNGLLDDLKNGLDIDAADELIADWVIERCGTEHAMGAGSGIGHFDRRFVKKYAPLFDKRLTYYPIDVGQMRRNLEIFGVEIDTSGAADPDVKFHRGEDDARQHLAEEVAYREAIRAAFGLGSMKP